MATEFLPFDDLRAAVAARDFDRPPALVANAHITGLGVARALAAHDVPVVALDRTGDGVAPYSDAVDLAGQVTYPLDDPDGFRADVEMLAAETGHEPVAFGCMDEWVHAFADTEPAGVRRPFADRDVVDAVLDKGALYAAADRLDVPYPETYRLWETDPDDAADALGFPLVVKPARKREFEEAVGTNVIEVADRGAYRDVLDRADAAGVRVMAQEKVPVERGADCSLASYVPPSDDEPLAVVGNPAVRYPLGYGTSTVVRRVDRPEIRDRALAVIEDAGYHGISESEFVYDVDRDEYVLLDVNTRPWKWISLPVQAGANLPMAAYADATGATYEADPVHDATWIYLRDYLALLAGDDPVPDVLSDGEWNALLSGTFEDRDDLVTGVYAPSDPGPTRRLVKTETSTREYYCSC